MDVKFLDFAYDAKNSVTLTCVATLTYKVGFWFVFLSPFVILLPIFVSKYSERYVEHCILE